MHNELTNLLERLTDWAEIAARELADERRVATGTTEDLLLECRETIANARKWEEAFEATFGTGTSQPSQEWTDNLPAWAKPSGSNA